MMARPLCPQTDNETDPFAKVSVENPEFSLFLEFSSLSPFQCPSMSKLRKKLVGYDGLATVPRTLSHNDPFHKASMILMLERQQRPVVAFGSPIVLPSAPHLRCSVQGPVSSWR